MKLTKQDLLIALIFFVIFQLSALLIWFVFDANYFIAMLGGAMGSYYFGYFRNRKASVQK